MAQTNLSSPTLVMANGTTSSRTSVAALGRSIATRKPFSFMDSFKRFMGLICPLEYTYLSTKCIQVLYTMTRTVCLALSTKRAQMPVACCLLGWASQARENVSVRFVAA
eukprot:COSAG02_NODE_12742_length_1501_cov_1.190442_2_plen_109_part_00